MKQSPFCMIVAHDLDRGIGINNQLPWRLSQDMIHFKQTTMGEGGNTVIMGRRTWASIPAQFTPLVDRKNIILSRDQAFDPGDEAVTVAHCLDDALAQSIGVPFVIGGAAIYQQAITDDRCQSLYITEVLSRVHCDAFFPSYTDEFSLIEQSAIGKENGYEFVFKVYERMKN